MSDDRYRFSIGDFECLAIKDTMTITESERVFSNIDRSIVKPHLKARGEKSKKIELSYAPLAVFSDDWVLIDTGIGKLGNDNGRVADILEDEEIRPEHIIITHAHADHFGGLLDENDEDTFGNVPVYMCQREWMMSTSAVYAEANPRRADMIQQYLLPVERQIERVECLNMNEILPGFTVLRLPGHTANHIGILIESGTDTLIYAGDAIIHPLHLEHLDWDCGFDEDHDLARESRIKLAELAIELDATVMVYHFPFPGLGKIVRHGNAYKWIPLNS